MTNGVENFKDDLTDLPETHLEGITSIYYDALIPDVDSPEGKIRTYGSYDLFDKSIAVDHHLKINKKGKKHSLFHEIGHHVWYDKVPVKLKLKWKFKCLQFRLYGVREGFADEYAAAFGAEREYMPERTEFKSIIQQIFSYLEKNPDKKNSKLNKLVSYILF